MNNKIKNKIMYWILFLISLSSITYMMLGFIYLSLKIPELFAGMLITFGLQIELIITLYLLAKINGYKGIQIEVN